VRVDLPGEPEIKAHYASLQQAKLSTRLQNGAAQVQTVEHLLAALAGLGIDNCRIELDGPEVPILDGSSLPFVEAILRAGVVAQSAVRPVGILQCALTVWDREAFVTVTPSAETRYSYGIDFADSPIRDQWFSWAFKAETFVEAIAPARTFTREQDIALAQQQGLIKGGSLDNAIVCTADSWHQPLRFENEPVRHKLIDLLGDLSLMGIHLQAHILAYKAGHALHHQLGQMLLSAGTLQLTYPPPTLIRFNPCPVT
jgi:UDP-3-O-[3-hydroxymyristoyl] N-acetylglucosamine deacetylase